MLPVHREHRAPSDILGVAYYKFQNKAKECLSDIYTELKDVRTKSNCNILFNRIL
jgi:predicted nucleotide-binding protein